MLAYADDMIRFSWKCWLLQHVFFKMALRRSGCGIDGQASVDTLHVIRSAMQDWLLALLMDGVSPCCGVCRRCESGFEEVWACTADSLGFQDGAWCVQL